MVHDHLVEADRAGHGARPAAEGHLEDRPLFDPVVAVEEPLQPLLEVLRLDLRQESKPAEVHPEQGNALWSSQTRASEEWPFPPPPAAHPPPLQPATDPRPPPP